MRSARNPTRPGGSVGRATIHPGCVHPRVPAGITAPAAATAAATISREAVGRIIAIDSRSSPGWTAYTPAPSSFRLVPGAIRSATEAFASASSAGSTCRDLARSARDVGASTEKSGGSTNGVPSLVGSAETTQSWNGCAAILRSDSAVGETITRTVKVTEFSFPKNPSGRTPPSPAG